MGQHREQYIDGEVDGQKPYPFTLLTQLILLKTMSKKFQEGKANVITALKVYQKQKEEMNWLWQNHTQEIYNGSSKEMV